MIKKKLLCGLCIATILLLAFIVDRGVLGSQGSRSKEQICLLYEAPPLSDRSQHREEDFDPSGKRVIWIYPQLRYYYDDFSVWGNLQVVDSLAGAVWQPCNENAWFSVGVYRYKVALKEDEIRTLRERGAYLSRDGENRAVGFMTGRQIQSMKDWPEEIVVGFRSRPASEFTETLEADHQPLENAAVIDPATFHWHTEILQSGYYEPLGDPAYTGAVYHITSMDELEMAIADGLIREPQAQSWREAYTGSYFQWFDLILYQIVYRAGEDLVPLRLEKSGSELRMVLSKASDLYTGGSTRLLVTQLRKSITWGIDTFSLRIAEPEGPVKTTDDFPVIITEMNEGTVRVSDYIHYLIGPDEPRSFVSVPDTSFLRKHMNRLLGQTFLTDEQRRLIRSDWLSRYTEEFFKDKWMLVWQVDLPGAFSGTKVEKTILMDKKLIAGNGAEPQWNDRHYEIYVSSGQKDPENGYETAVLILELPQNRVDKFDIYLDGVKVDTNWQKQN